MDINVNIISGVEDEMRALIFAINKIHNNACIYPVVKLMFQVL